SGTEAAKQMAEAPSKIESMRKWVVDHKLRAVGCLWLSGISSSIAFNWSRPNMKTSVKLIHAKRGSCRCLFLQVFRFQIYLCHLC
uniref:HIG1 domain-containing protein n=1 Tax=Aegilops tauschii subsp. strangulata TaxID=200361 RepID=A0A453CUS6_AEGTS